MFNLVKESLIHEISFYLLKKKKKKKSSSMLRLSLPYLVNLTTERVKPERRMYWFSIGSIASKVVFVVKIMQ